MAKIVFRNNSISGRDYRAKGLHIVIEGYGVVTQDVPDDMVAKVLTDFRRSSPAIQVGVEDPKDLPVYPEPGVEPEQSPEKALVAKNRVGRSKSAGKKNRKRSNSQSTTATLPEPGVVTVGEVTEG